MRRTARTLAAVGLLFALLAACGHVGPLVPPEDGNGDTAADSGY